MRKLVISMKPTVRPVPRKRCRIALLMKRICCCMKQLPAFAMPLIFKRHQDEAATMLCMVFGPHIPVLGRGLGELPNKRKGINFCQQPYKGRRAKGYPFPLLAKSFVICSRVPHLATFQKDSAFQKSTFLFRFVRDDTLNMNT